MIVKKVADHLIAETPTCGEVRGILQAADYEGVNVAIALDIRPTHAHFHLSFDEIYFVLDGQLTLDLYDPTTDERTTVELGPNELCVIQRGTHHVVAAASDKNRLCVITAPHFDAADEHMSDRL